MSTILIRPAVIADLETLRLFEQGVVEAERPFDPTLADGPLNYYDLEAMILADHVALLVAETDGQIIASGYARIETSKHFLRHTNHAYLGFMYVVPEFRGQGVNHKIIQALITWIQSKGLDELRLEVYQHNSAAIRAYEKLGFTRHLIEMRLSIQDIV
jgi:ribosomal protein S18 acetylase RimI-like enzyme